MAGGAGGWTGGWTGAAGGLIDGGTGAAGRLADGLTGAGALAGVAGALVAGPLAGVAGPLVAGPLAGVAGALVAGALAGAAGSLTGGLTGSAAKGTATPGALGRLVPEGAGDAAEVESLGTALTSTAAAAATGVAVEEGIEELLEGAVGALVLDPVGSRAAETFSMTDLTLAMSSGLMSWTEPTSLTLRGFFPSKPSTSLTIGAKMSLISGTSKRSAELFSTSARDI